MKLNEAGVSRICSEQALLEQFYGNEGTTSDNIASITKYQTEIFHLTCSNYNTPSKTIDSRDLL